MDKNEWDIDAYLFENCYFLLSISIAKYMEKLG